MGNQNYESDYCGAYLIMVKNKTAWGQYCVLDDETDFLEIAKVKISKYLPEIKGIFTSSVEEVLEIAKSSGKTLFVIDINLGNTNGIDIYKKISAMSAQNRVIFITGDSNIVDDPEIREKALSQEGGIDFIEKPVKWHELAIKIRNHLKLMEYQSDLEAKVQERTAMLIHADRLTTIGTMVSSIVHEVSSPLTFIKANQENTLLAWEKAKPMIESKEAIDFIEYIIIGGVKDSLMGVRQIEDLLKSFRKFYKQEKTISVTDIKSILDEVKTLTVFNLKKQSIRFEVEDLSEENPSIKVNKQEIVQVLTNIINNAIDAMEGMTRTDKFIKTTIEKTGKIVKITVSNNGPKIPENIINNIFEPFFTTKPEEKGTGLGLAIVKQILKNISGDITIKNKKDDKSTLDFIITIPLHQSK